MSNLYFVFLEYSKKVVPIRRYVCKNNNTSFLILHFQITCYLGKRDFIDYMDHVDPIGMFWNPSWKFTKKRKTERCFIDGVVLVDPEYVKDRKVYASVLAGIILLIIKSYLNFLFNSISIWSRRSRCSRFNLSERFILFNSTNLSSNWWSKKILNTFTTTSFT